MRGFELGNFDRIQIRRGETLSEFELAERVADAGAKGLAFVQRLRAIPHIGGYIILNRNGFTFSMDKHRDARAEEFKKLFHQVCGAFCEVYGFTKVRLS